VRFINPKDLSNQTGFFDKLFSRKSEDDFKKAKRYRVIVKEQGAIVNVTVLDEKGNPEKGETAIQLLTILDQQTGR
jgi:outer membrane protein assembly factor BamC